MRHRKGKRHLNRTSEHRKAMIRNMTSSLIENETISSTPEKAGEVRSFIEKLISLGKKGTLSARRRAIKILGDRDILEEQDDRMVKEVSIIGKLFSELGPRYLERAGGYTRIIRLSKSRVGDGSRLVLLQLIGQDEAVEESSRAEKVSEHSGEEKQEVASKESKAVEETEKPEQQEEAVDDTSSKQEESEQQ